MRLGVLVVGIRAGDTVLDINRVVSKNCYIIIYKGILRTGTGVYD